MLLFVFLKLRFEFFERVSCVKENNKSTFEIKLANNQVLFA